MLNRCRKTINYCATLLTDVKNALHADDQAIIFGNTLVGAFFGLCVGTEFACWTVEPGFYQQNLNKLKLEVFKEILTKFNCDLITVPYRFALPAYDSADLQCKTPIEAVECYEEISSKMSSLNYEFSKEAFSIFNQQALKFLLGGIFGGVLGFFSGVAFVNHKYLKENAPPENIDALLAVLMLIDSANEREHLITLAVKKNALLDKEWLSSLAKDLNECIRNNKLTDDQAKALSTMGIYTWLMQGTKAEIINKDMFVVISEFLSGVTGEEFRKIHSVINDRIFVGAQTQLAKNYTAKLFDKKTYKERQEKIEQHYEESAAYCPFKKHL